MENFSNFLYSFGAARRLLEHAHTTGSLIEGLVVYVSLIDGLLRIAIILEKQLQHGSGDFDFSYIEQKQSGPKYTERQIFEEAYRRKIIGSALKRKIADLYEKRNAVIHRFFLTGLKYVDLEPWLDSYEDIYLQCYDIVYKLESRQLREGKGMTKTGQPSDREHVNKAVIAKLGLDMDLSAL
jgi:hypothetical protein